MELNETIVALSTPMGEAALHVIRLSGSQAEEIIDKCFQTNSPAWLRGDVFVLCLGWFVDGEKRIDQILAARMKAPASFTGETVVEINCHGGHVVARRIIDLCCRHGARLAHPGEFSKRAFLNGKIDLIQAEGIIDLINAKNDISADLALVQLEGRLSEDIKALRSEMIDILATIEAHIDFPEEEVDLVQEDTLRQGLEYLRQALSKALQGSKTGKIIRDGIMTVIAGTPNVGKSSLLNAFVKEDRAIVTDIPGTTRDEIHEYVTLGDMVLHLIDTAGLRVSEDPIEAIGIARTEKALEKADVILFLLDGTRIAQGLLRQQEREILQVFGHKMIILVNKMDLIEETKMEIKRFGDISFWDDRCILDGEVVPGLIWIPFSVKMRTGFERLEEELRKMFLAGFDMHKQPFLTNMRQIDAVQSCLVNIEKALVALDAHTPFDLIAIDIQSALLEISLVTGHDMREDVIERIFQRFCIGK